MILSQAAIHSSHIASPLQVSAFRYNSASIAYPAACDTRPCISLDNGWSKGTFSFNSFNTKSNTSWRDDVYGFNGSPTVVTIGKIGRASCRERAYMWRGAARREQ